jgi:RNA polymerase sigma factor (sigma-70 family)
MPPERLGFLLDTHAAALELFAAQWTVAPEDVVQEAFIELTKQTSEPDNIVAWLYTVVRHRAISAARATERRRRHEGLAAAFAERLVPATDDDAAIDARIAAEALHQLPENQREVVVARLWGGLGFTEIAAIVGTSTSTTHRRYESAIATLRERLGLKWTMTESKATPTVRPRTTSKGC